MQTKATNEIYREILIRDINFTKRKCNICDNINEYNLAKSELISFLNLYKRRFGVDYETSSIPQSKWIIV